MDWSNWSSIAQIVASGAILITLLFIALEIRQNTRAIQADAREAILQGDVNWLYKAVEDPDLILLMKQEEPLTDRDAEQLNSYFVAFMRLKEAGYRQHQAGVLDEKSWENYRSSIHAGPMATRYGRIWWANFGQHLFDRQMSAEVTEALERTPVFTSSLVHFAPSKAE